MICVLDVTGGPARGRRFWVRNNQRVEIGRISTADFAVPTDPHMSRRHLILEGTVSAFRVRDVGSANGTYVNNAKIASVELCTGDRIRAGETTFEVSVLDDDDSPHGKDGFNFRSISGSRTVPTRSLSISESADAITEDELDDEMTRRCSLPESLAQPIVIPLASAVDSADSQAGGSTQRDVTETSRVCGVSRAGTLKISEGWWLDFAWERTDISCLLAEPAARPGSQLTLPALLRRVEPEFSLTAVVKVERLGRFGRQLLGTMVEQGGVTWHQPGLCSILDDRSRDFARLAETSLTHDACILLGARTALDHGWLNDFTSMVSQPSELARQLRDPFSSMHNRILERVEFVIFEQNSQGQLYLLLRDLLDAHS